jgi:hypothetical protein
MDSSILGSGISSRALIILTGLMCSWRAPAMDTVTREIRCERGTVWVEDKLHISEDFANTNNKLGNVFDAVKGRKTNILERVRLMIEGEDLEIQTCKFAFTNDIMDMTIRSTVTPRNPDKPSMLHWLSTFGGYHAGLEDEDPKKADGQMLVFSHDGRHIMWLPQLPSWSPFIRELEEEKLTFDRFFSLGYPVRFECVLKMGDRSERLLLWDIGVQTADVPDASLMKQLNDFHKASGNDDLDLFTSLHVARAGYYKISEYTPAAKTEIKSKK